jgi:hypothetical protein
MTQLKILQSASRKNNEQLDPSPQLEPLVGKSSKTIPKLDKPVKQQAVSDSPAVSVRGPGDEQVDPASLTSAASDGLADDSTSFWCDSTAFPIWITDGAETA